MRRHCSERLERRLLEKGLRSVAYALPGMLWQNRRDHIIHRTLWRLERPLEHNMANLRLDCSAIVHRFGRSPVG